MTYPMGLNQGMLDPMYGQTYGFSQFTPSQLDIMNPQQPVDPNQGMLDPRRAIWAAALSNIGNIFMGQAPQQNIGSAYMQSKMYNDKLRENKAAKARQAEQDEIDRQLKEAQIEKLSAEAQAKRGGMFQGTGMEAQALNIFLDPNIPDSHPAKIAASQRLSKPTTVSTPEGTYVRPGYDLEELRINPQGAVEVSQAVAPTATTQTDMGDFYQKKPTEGERRAGYSAESMQAINDRLVNENYIPTMDEYMASKAGAAGNLYTSPEFKDWKRNADEWARNLVFLRSGATARQEEVDAAVQNYWPQPGDEPIDLERKKQARDQAMSQAIKMGGTAVTDTQKPDLVWNPKTRKLEPAK